MAVGRVVSWLVVALLAWLVWVGVLFMAQRRLVFPRHLLNPPSPRPALPPGVRRVDLDTAAGPGLAWYLPPGPVPPEGRDRAEAASEHARRSGAGSAAPALLFAHGNAELARDWTAAWRAVAERGFGVLLVEYPGYDEAPGAPGLESIADVMVAARDWLAARPEVDGSRIVGVGRSLGGGAVTELARRRPLAGLVLQSTFTRVRDFARRLLVPGALIRDPFDNLDVVESFAGPVLIFHGRSDQVIPYEHGRRLARAAPDAEMVTWECGHNDCPPDWFEYVDRLVEFAGRLEPSLDGGETGRAPGRAASAASPGDDSPHARTPESTRGETMAVEHVTAWLAERKPRATVSYEGMDEDDIHVWELDFPETEHEFRVGVPDSVIQDEGLLAERLMELETQGWLDEAGEKDLWVLVAAGEIGGGPSGFR